MIGCLRTRVRNQPIIALYFEFENEINLETWYFIATDVIEKSVKNWNRMQNAADLGIFYQCEGYACFIKFDFVRIFSYYWYELCDVLVPVLHVR